MFYRPEKGHGLPHNPFSAIVAPRPIGWISTRAAGGDNLAPYSFFNAVAYVPPQVMFASTSAKEDRDGTKDSMSNIRESGVFCVNLVGHALREAMNRTSGPWPREVDEFADANLAKAECEAIACPRVADAPASLECRLTRIVRLPGETNLVAFGEVVGVHIREEFLVDGRFDTAGARLLARCGYRDYAVVDEVFELTRPGE
ncbi:flavin reductase (DIM6/NTAB) family NADH-FMN oxidoreductase RutF [Hasllibacter halocynthiae]|uniref:Flavin reductase (DIM6/NTAB) family NADH-FMN oxidoreductase RutF n=1 Tax=Hasllibacter halocynthiae TaxID=595589 RepID=A0A2T0X674_9RHOB|nr:flavin reductase family protein [Hasllibacter halocynthiae]PRY94423.1 flavin reductase (DIM6/NTAB) family NADH-FMN oxidoreductase RutF [Hasllibacter halocynthiae]